MQITTDAIVIREKQYNGDRILLLLSKDLGIITAYAKEAKNPKGKFTSSTELFCYSKFVLFKKKDNYWVNAADINNMFFPIRQDIVKFALASYLCELTAYLAPADEHADEYLRLILNSLYFISENKPQITFIKPLYELRLLTMAGFMPNLIACKVCGKFEDIHMYFSYIKGDIICSKCLIPSANDKLIEISTSVLAAMRYIIYSDFNKLFSFEINPKSLKTLSDVTQAYMLSSIDFIPKTLSFFNSVSI